MGYEAGLAIRSNSQAAECTAELVDPMLHFGPREKTWINHCKREAVPLKAFSSLGTMPHEIPQFNLSDRTQAPRIQTSDGWLESAKERVAFRAVP